MILNQEAELVNYQHSLQGTPATIFPPSEIVLTQKDIEESAKVKPQPQVKKITKVECFVIIFGILISLGVITFVIIEFTLLNKEKNAEIYDMVKLSSSSALCLDGSSTGYYVSRTGNSSKILIYFQGGGWCSEATDEATLEACYQRSFTVLGSSNELSQVKSITEGMMSQDPKNYFKDWKKVYFHYCDGTGHQGTRKEPILYKGRNLYFRGHNITVQRFEELQKNLGLFTKADKVMITGESAGGLAATMWTNYLDEKVQNGQVLSVPDAGIFYDSVNLKTKTNLYREKFVNLMKISNAEIDPPVSDCLEKYPDSKVDCMFAQNLFEHIKVPLFVTQSLYDYYSISQIIGASCIIDSIPSCSNEEFSQIEDNRYNVTSVLQQIAQNKANGVWGLACVRHQTLATAEFVDEKYSVNEYTGYTASRAIGEWIENPDQNNVHLDMFPWPNNRPCA